MSLTSYSPNCEYSTHRVEILLQQREYTRTYQIDVSADQAGMNILDAAVEMLCEEIGENSMNADGDIVITLTDSKGNTLLCEDEEWEGDDWLKRMIVSMRIIAVTFPTLNEVRALNGTPPLPVDSPYEPL